MPIEQQEFLDSYKKLGGDLKKLSEKFSLSERTIRHYKAKYGLTKPKKANISVEELRQLYCVELLSVVDIAEKLGVHRDTVYSYLSKNNITRESKYNIELIRDLYSTKNYNITQLLKALNISNRETLLKLLKEHNIVNPIKETITQLYSNNSSVEGIAKVLNIPNSEVLFNLKHHSIYRERIPEINLEEFKKLRCTKSLEELAEYYNCSTRTIAQFISKNNLPSYKNLAYLDFPYEEVYHLYIEKNYTLDELAAKYGCSRTTIGKFVLANNIVKSTRESSIERKIKEWLDSNNIEYEQNCRKLITPYEIDFYLLEYDIAIEVCGVYWHSTKNNADKLHIYKKYLKCKSEGFRLITIFEDEINNSFEIVTSRLKSILGLSKSKLYARNCCVREITSREGIDFLNKYHLQKSGKNKIYLGAFFKEELVSVMSFSGLNPAKGRQAVEGEFELNRFANPKNAVGIASKLVSFFKKTYKPIKIISYADLRWSDGNLYRALDFSYVRTSAPNYWYVVRNERVHRWAYTKQKLLTMTDTTNNDITEEELAESLGLYRIYDCGNLVYEWKA
jgi:DNA-binding transcriptional MerR regulator/very-short-patch-repair endonuclease/DNA-binding XRE family transcriptional regulator